MKLSIEAVAKMTGLSPSTVRQYAWERKIGHKEGRSRVFTVAEAKRLGGLKDGFKKASARGRPPKKLSTKRARSSIATEQRSTVAAKEARKERRSFWSFLGIGRTGKR